jgi:hypothetical protein
MNASDQPLFDDSDALYEHLLRVYDDYRTARMNQKYYARRLSTYKRLNLTFEGALGVGTSGTIGSLAIWQTAIGTFAWALIAGATAIIAVLKPIIPISKELNDTVNYM